MNVPLWWGTLIMGALCVWEVGCRERVQRAMLCTVCSVML